MARTPDIVRVHAGPTHFDIDFNAALENGYVDTEEHGYNSQDMIAAVYKALRSNTALPTANGGLALIMSQVFAYEVI